MASALLVLFPVIPMIWLLGMLWFYWKVQPKFMSSQKRLYWEDRILEWVHESGRIFHTCRFRFFFPAGYMLSE